MSVLTILKEEVEQTFSRKILSSVDCHQLSEHIFQRTGERINANTLRRCFGLVKTAYPPSQNTLTLLSRYCGFHSADELLAHRQRRQAPVAPEHEPLLHYLVTLFGNLNVASYADATCFSLVRHTIFFFQQQPALIHPFQRAVAKHPNGQVYYFELFVNIDKLSSYYSDGLHHYLAEKKTVEAQIFGHAVLCLGAWLRNDTAKVVLYGAEVARLGVYNDLHPFVWGRHFATRLLVAEATGGDMGPILLEASKAYERLRPSEDQFRHFPCFELIFADALILAGQYEEALYYASRGLSRRPMGSLREVDEQLFHALHLYKVIALAETGAADKARDLLPAVEPTEFYFLARQYLNIHYLRVLGRLTRSRSHEAQLRHLLSQTGFTRLGEREAMDTESSQVA